MGKKVVGGGAGMKRSALRKLCTYVRSRSNALQAMDGWDGVDEVRSRLHDAGLTTVGPFHHNGNSFLEVPLWVHVAAFENKKDGIVDFVCVSVAKNELGVSICAPSMFSGGRELASYLLDNTKMAGFSSVEIRCVDEIGVVSPFIHLDSVAATPTAVAEAVSDLVDWILVIGVYAMQMRASLQGMRDYAEDMKRDEDSLRRVVDAVINDVCSGAYFSRWEQNTLFAMKSFNIGVKCGCMYKVCWTHGWSDDAVQLTDDAEVQPALQPA